MADNRNDAAFHTTPLRDLHRDSADMFCRLAEGAEPGSDEQRAFVAAAITAAVRRLTVHVNIISGTEPKRLPRSGSHDLTACDLVAAKDDLLVLASALEHAPLSRAWARVQTRLQERGVELPQSQDEPFGQFLRSHVLVPECAKWAVETVASYLACAEEEYAKPPPPPRTPPGPPDPPGTGPTRGRRRPPQPSPDP